MALTPNPLPNPNPNPNPKPNPTQDYGPEEEGSEWRWPALATRAVASDEEAEEAEGAVVVAARFESEDEDEAGGAKAGGGDREVGDASPRPLFIRRPCGRGPNGNERDPHPHHSPLTPHPSPH